MTVRLAAPVSTFTGAVVGVDFVDGKAALEDGDPRVAYFLRHGYSVDADGAKPSRPKK